MVILGVVGAGGRLHIVCAVCRWDPQVRRPRVVHHCEVLRRGADGHVAIVLEVLCVVKRQCVGASTVGRKQSGTAEAVGSLFCQQSQSTAGCCLVLVCSLRKQQVKVAC